MVIYQRHTCPLFKIKILHFIIYLLCTHMHNSSLNCIKSTIVSNAQIQIIQSISSAKYLNILSSVLWSLRLSKTIQ